MKFCWLDVLGSGRVFTQWTAAHQSMETRKKYWSGLPFHFFKYSLHQNEQIPSLPSNFLKFKKKLQNIF